MRGAALALVLYCSNSMAADGLLWFDGGRLGAQARQAVELLSAAATHGLEPQDYNASALRQAVMNAMQAAPPEPAMIARLEPALTTAMEHYLSDLHTGRIDPRQVHHDFKPLRREAFDPGAYLRAALAASRLSEAAREAAPQMPLYERLREQLAHYRGWIGHPAWEQPLPPLPGNRRGQAGKLEPGQDYAGLAIMAQRLVVLGDLAPDAITPPRYEEPLISAVQAFQQRHGLAADGVIGKATLTQLQVAPADRARQIELALERLRWTPLMQGPRMIVINSPAFVLHAYEVRGSRIVVLQEMKVIVGKTIGTRTPLFDEDLRFIEFSPYWNVPPSIARAEVVPRLRRDPGYFAREGFEFVSSTGQVDTTLSEQNLDAVLAGRARVRQRPGPQNALGDIKFVFPNRNNIYLHHTPATKLFERDRRDLSHGCIRVEQPVALAKFVLQDTPDWSEERIRASMGKGESATIRLTEPVRVLIAYGTVLVKGGQIHFFEDIYGLDRLLDTALRQRAHNQPSID